MNSEDDLNSRAIEEAKKTAPNTSQPAIPGGSVLRSFFLKTESEMEASIQRGRKSSRSSVLTAEAAKDVLDNESQFGVQSLEETLSMLSPVETAYRTDSISSDRSSEANTPAKRKRKAGNRVHPSIRSAGERIISSERVHAQPPSQLPTGPDSPFQSPHLRRASPINMTPMRMSPHLISATPSTPRSGSPRSFQLSDVESIAEESSSQAVQSFSGDDELERMPQLVFPSLTMPPHRAFTEKGKHIGRAKFMVIGDRKGLGSTSFINNILRSSEHVVHVDHLAIQISCDTDDSDLISSIGGADGPEQQKPSSKPSSCHFTELLASTRMLPSWRTQGTQSEYRTLLQNKQSGGDGALDRNVTFIDCPSADQEGAIQAVLNYVAASLHRTAHMESMADSEIVRLLSGDGGDQITAIFYLFDPVSSEAPVLGLSLAHQDLLRCASKYTNLIPLIGKADTVSAEALQLRKEQISKLLELLHATPYRFAESTDNTVTREPLAISSLPGNDSDTIDASILMSSQYLAPLVPSELGYLVENLVEPENLARMRYESSLRFLLWRKENPSYHCEQKRLPHLLSPQTGYQTTDLASDASFPETSSKALVPQSAISFDRSNSPALSDNLAHSGANMGPSALARYNEQAQSTEPFRRVRLAKWARDLQSSLQNQSRRYQTIYQTPLSDWAMNEDDNDHALFATKGGRHAARGHLGGEIGVIDPRDPLGLLGIGQAFRLRGYMVVQLAGGCAIVGAVFYYVAKNWSDVAEFIGFSPSTGVVHATAVPPLAPTDRSVLLRWFADSKPLGWTW